MEQKTREEQLNIPRSDAPETALEISPNAEVSTDEREREEKQPQKWKGALFIALAAFCFSLMSVFVRLSGELPTFQKAFFRNFVAAVASFFLLLKSGSFKMQKGSACVGTFFNHFF